ncbi:hypothetical protein SAMN05428985_11072 [Nocardioides sp. YR527]|uniref:hypothetical protein n=1 Tax=Nocardioides sp. YR527 TaxID=1881028 RepID=UPI000889C469|nr:hypothetical protein [Nocardioides sp. YR527]SDL15128.1 hypothetical protein SAMN05428985_11072 [Nocardioides sp. YR527]
MADPIGESLEIQPTACTSCRMGSEDCMARLNRTSVAGKGQKRGRGGVVGRGLACCTSCADGNTHPATGEGIACADHGKMWARKK